jgi:hypothetical protein
MGSSPAKRLFVRSKICGEMWGLEKWAFQDRVPVLNQPFRSTSSQTTDESAAPKPDPKLGLDELPKENEAKCEELIRQAVYAF